MSSQNWESPSRNRANTGPQLNAYYVPGMRNPSHSTKRTQSTVLTSQEIPMSAVKDLDLATSDLNITDSDAHEVQKLVAGNRKSRRQGPQSQLGRTTEDIERGKIEKGKIQNSPQSNISRMSHDTRDFHSFHLNPDSVGGKSARHRLASTESDMRETNHFHPSNFKTPSKIGPRLAGPSVVSDAATIDPMDVLPDMNELENYRKHKELGTGTDAMVYEVIDRRDKSHVAMKLTKRKSGRYRTEIHLLHQLRTSPYIVKLLKVLEDDRVYVLILEQAPMTLESLLQERCTEVPMQEKVARTIMADTFKGLQAIHNLGFAHKDIKPENILIFANRQQRKLQAKIADFGFATRVQPSRDVLKSTPKEMPHHMQQEFLQRVADKCGTPGFWPPELVAQCVTSLEDAFKMDVFSVGVTLYRMLCNEMPFGLFETWDVKSGDDGIPKLTKMKPTFQVISWVQIPSNAANNETKLDYKRVPSKETLSDDVCDLLRGMLRIRPHRRFKIEECLSHKWLQASEQ